MERQVPLFHEQIQHGLLGVEAVFRLVEDLVGVGLKDRCGDLLSPVAGRQCWTMAPGWAAAITASLI